MADQMNFEALRRRVLKAAQEAGIEQAEIYTARSQSMRAMATGGEIADYAVADRLGVSLRGVYAGRMGYCSTQAADEDAVEQLIEGVKESASLVKSEDEESIYPGDAHYAKVESYSEALEAVQTAQKLEFLRALEAAVSAYDPRLRPNNASLSTGKSEVTLQNTYGLCLEHRDNALFVSVSVAAKEGEKVAAGYAQRATRDFSSLCVDALVREAGDDALAMLSAKPVNSGNYAVVFKADAMVDLLDAFCGVFSAENAQKGLSLLNGREGSAVAAPCVSIIDDPLMENGFATCPFDAEGVAAYKKTVIDKGVLKTLLHNRTTAAKAGVSSTGNAAKDSYASPVKVAPSNFYIEKGECSLNTLLQTLGEGLMITEVSGLHAGANAVSGDFSLLCQGYVVHAGKVGRAVNQITVAGNFFTLLERVTAVADDLYFPGEGVGSPSVLVSELSVAGK